MSNARTQVVARPSETAMTLRGRDCYMESDDGVAVDGTQSTPELSINFEMPPQSAESVAVTFTLEPGIQKMSTQCIRTESRTIFTGSCLLPSCRASTPISLSRTIKSPNTNQPLEIYWTGSQIKLSDDPPSERRLGSFEDSESDAENYSPLVQKLTLARQCLSPVLDDIVKDSVPHNERTVVNAAREPSTRQPVFESEQTFDQVNEEAVNKNAKQRSHRTLESVRSVAQRSPQRVESGRLLDDMTDGGARQRSAKSKMTIDLSTPGREIRTYESPVRSVNNNTDERRDEDRSRSNKDHSPSRGRRCQVAQESPLSSVRIKIKKPTINDDTFRQQEIPVYAATTTVSHLPNNPPSRERDPNRHLDHVLNLTNEEILRQKDFNTANSHGRSSATESAKRTQSSTVRRKSAHEGIDPDSIMNAADSKSMPLINALRRNPSLHVFKLYHTALIEQMVRLKDMLEEMIDHISKTQTAFDSSSNPKTFDGSELDVKRSNKMVDIPSRGERRSTKGLSSASELDLLACEYVDICDKVNKIEELAKSDSSIGTLMSTLGSDTSPVELIRSLSSINKLHKGKTPSTETMCEARRKIIECLAQMVQVKNFLDGGKKLELADIEKEVRGANPKNCCLRKKPHCHGVMAGIPVLIRYDRKKNASIGDKLNERSIIDMCDKFNPNLPKFPQEHVIAYAKTQPRPTNSEIQRNAANAYEIIDSLNLPQSRYDSSDRATPMRREIQLHYHVGSDSRPEADESRVRVSGKPSVGVPYNPSCRSMPKDLFSESNEMTVPEPYKVYCVPNSKAGNPFASNKADRPGESRGNRTKAEISSQDVSEAAGWREREEHSRRESRKSRSSRNSDGFVAGRNTKFRLEDDRNDPLRDSQRNGSETRPKSAARDSERFGDDLENKLTSRNPHIKDPGTESENYSQSRKNTVESTPRSKRNSSRFDDKIENKMVSRNASLKEAETSTGNSRRDSRKEVFERPQYSERDNSGFDDVVENKLAIRNPSIKEPDTSTGNSRRESKRDGYESRRRSTRNSGKFEDVVENQPGSKNPSLHEPESSRRESRKESLVTRPTSNRNSERFNIDIDAKLASIRAFVQETEDSLASKLKSERNSIDKTRPRKDTDNEPETEESASEMPNKTGIENGITYVGQRRNDSNAEDELKKERASQRKNRRRSKKNLEEAGGKMPLETPQIYAMGQVKVEFQPETAGNTRKVPERDVDQDLMDGRDKESCRQNNESPNENVIQSTCKREKRRYLKAVPYSPSQRSMPKRHLHQSPNRQSPTEDTVEKKTPVETTLQTPRTRRNSIKHRTRNQSTDSECSNQSAYRERPRTKTVRDQNRSSLDSGTGSKKMSESRDTNIHKHDSSGSIEDSCAGERSRKSSKISKRSERRESDGYKGRRSRISNTEQPVFNGDEAKKDPVLIESYHTQVRDPELGESYLSHVARSRPERLSIDQREMIINQRSSCQGLKVSNDSFEKLEVEQRLREATHYAAKFEVDSLVQQESAELLVSSANPESDVKQSRRGSRTSRRSTRKESADTPAIRNRDNSDNETLMTDQSRTAPLHDISEKRMKERRKARGESLGDELKSVQLENVSDNLSSKRAERFASLQEELRSGHNAMKDLSTSRRESEKTQKESDRAANVEAVEEKSMRRRETEIRKSESERPENLEMLQEDSIRRDTDKNRRESDITQELHQSRRQSERNRRETDSSKRNESYIDDEQNKVEPLQSRPTPGEIADTKPDKNPRRSRRRRSVDSVGYIKAMPYMPSERSIVTGKCTVDKKTNEKIPFKNLQTDVYHVEQTDPHGYDNRRPKKTPRQFPYLPSERSLPAAKHTPVAHRSSDDSGDDDKSNTIENMMYLSAPSAPCARQNTLNAPSTVAYPYSTSIKSLPLDEEDFKDIAKRAERMKGKSGPPRSVEQQYRVLVPAPRMRWTKSSDNGSRSRYVSSHGEYDSVDEEVERDGKEGVDMLGDGSKKGKKYSMKEECLKWLAMPSGNSSDATLIPETNSECSTELRIISRHKTDRSIGDSDNGGAESHLSVGEILVEKAGNGSKVCQGECESEEKYMNEESTSPYARRRKRQTKEPKVFIVGAAIKIEHFEKDDARSDLPTKDVCQLTDYQHTCKESRRNRPRSMSRQEPTTLNTVYESDEERDNFDEKKSTTKSLRTKRNNSFGSITQYSAYEEETTEDGERVWKRKEIETRKRNMAALNEARKEREECRGGGGENQTGDTDADSCSVECDHKKYECSTRTQSLVTTSSDEETRCSKWSSEYEDCRSEFRRS